MSAITQMGRANRKSQKKPRTETEEGQEGSSTVDAENPEGEDTDDRLYDGLSFWIASKTVSVRMSNLETDVKRMFLDSGFSIEECSVSF